MRREHSPDERDMSDAMIAALAEEGTTARRNTAIPPASVVWWRAQMRARREAEAAVTRPITVVQGLAVACAVGLALGIAGFAGAWLRDVLRSAVGWSSAAASLAARAGVLDLTAGWIAWPATIVLTSALLASVAVYVITADE